MVRFGAFELDARAGELLKDGVRLNLQEQPFKVLECLLERPGELLTREELRQRLWASRHVRGLRPRGERGREAAARDAWGLGRDSAIHRDSAAPRLSVLNPVTLDDHRHGRLEKFEQFRGGLAVSPGQTILYPGLVNRGADLMLIQNFR
jgi:hypothetical protein